MSGPDDRTLPGPDARAAKLRAFFASSVSARAGVRDPRIAAAFAAVPHRRAGPARPCLDALAPQPGETVLQIGARSGYCTAILAHLVGRRFRAPARPGRKSFHENPAC